MLSDRSECQAGDFATFAGAIAVGLIHFWVKLLKALGLSYCTVRVQSVVSLRGRGVPQLAGCDFETHVSIGENGTETWNHSVLDEIGKGQG